jgi:hypothetical protein
MQTIFLEKPCQLLRSVSEDIHCIQSRLQGGCYGDESIGIYLRLSHLSHCFSYRICLESGQKTFKGYTSQLIAIQPTSNVCEVADELINGAYRTYVDVQARQLLFP